LHIINYVSTALNDGNYCIGVFLDLKKAFDVCSHSILLKKLAKMGITGVSHRWFSDYLSGRSQKVEINGKFSEAQNLDISVIQGSTLGPLLLLCYINDFFTATTLFSVLFADDTTCLSKGKKLDELILYVNQELQKIALWFKANKMAVNTAKTKYIVFRTQGKYVNNDLCRLVFNNNVPGVPEDPNLIHKLIEYITRAQRPVLNCLVFFLMSTYHLMNIFLMSLQKSLNHSSALTKSQTLSIRTP
jgi:hypothetical protein